jgi:outer membrane receptor protein involved in Fe transport
LDHGCRYIDPNPLSKLNNQGHNYFLSQNPYTLNSYAGFGEAYYDVLSDLKLTAGLRWTEDQKHFTLIPSELLEAGYGYPSTGVVDQQWNELTGRAAVNWTPKLDFTDQTLVYGTYSHGYKAGGANPPGAELLSFTGADISNPIHPLTFKPEFVDAFELGSKNTLFDGALTFNADVFYYNYENYQISRIVDRTSINDNFDAYVKGAEIESSWEPAPGLRFNFAGGWEDAKLAQGTSAVDLMDRAGLLRADQVDSPDVYRLRRLTFRHRADKGQAEHIRDARSGARSQAHNDFVARHDQHGTGFDFCEYLRFSQVIIPGLIGALAFVAAPPGRF